MGPPVVAVAATVLVPPTSTDLAATVTDVVVVAVFLARLELHSLPTRRSSDLMVPAVAGAVALIVIVALAPEASEPTPQVTVPEALVQERWSTRLNSSHSRDAYAAFSLAPMTASGPLFFAVRV